MDGTQNASGYRRQLVLGLGNPVLGDDGIGWHVAEQVQHEVDHLNDTTEVDCLAVGGLRLMERLIGYDRVILIDSVTTGQHPPGHLACYLLTDLPDPAAGHLTSAHDTSLQTALQVGHTLGASLPAEILAVTVEAEPTFDFSEMLTPPVAAAVEPAVQQVLRLLGESNHEEQSP